MSESYKSPTWGPPPEERRSAKASRRKLAIVAAGGAIAVAAFVVLALPEFRDDAAKDRRAATAAQARLEAAERARLVREGKPVRVQGPAGAARPALVAAAEAAITRDALRRTAEGEIKGKGEIRGTHCRPFPYTDTRAAQERDRSITRNRYQCIAYSSRFALSELEGRKRTGLFGTPYWLIAEYATGQLVFCKISPRAGEGGRVLVEVPVDPACHDPLG